MAYIGQGIKNGTFAKLDTSGNTYNGSNVTFALGTQVGSPVQLLVSHDGVIQNPGTDYTLASNGTQITFSNSPCKWCFYIYYGNIWCSWRPNEQRFKWRRTYLRCRW